MATTVSPAAPARLIPAPRLAVALGIVAGLVGIAVVSFSAATALGMLGLPDPGKLTTYGLPFVRSAGEIAAVVMVGGLLHAAFLVPPQASGVLDVAGYASLRLASAAAGVWAAAAFFMVPLTLSDVTGAPLSESISPDAVLGALGLVDAASAWLWTAGLALGVAAGARVVLRWRWLPALLALGLATVIPLALAGHSSSGGSHDIASNSLLIHLLAATLWAGGVVALLVHAGRGGEHLALAVRRFSRVALWCFFAMGLSGVLNAAVRVGWADLASTDYGRLIVVKAAALGVLGVLGAWLRRSVIAGLADAPPARGVFARFALGEALVMAATVGVAVGLGRTPPPAPQSLPSITEVELGYNLPLPPSVATLAGLWRFDLIFGTAALVLAGGYLVGLWRLRRRGDSWPRGRTVSWIAGCATLLVATSSGLGAYAPAAFSVHMASHMALNMLVPVLLVLGGPITLALRAIPVGAKDVPGPREWILAALHSAPSRILSHPVVVLVTFVGSFYGLYFSGLFASAASNHGAHLAMNLHFLITGYLFYWVVVGVDPAPRRLPPLGKLGVVFAALPFHAFFGVILMGYTEVIAGDFYRGLGLSWNRDLLDIQRTGGGIAWSAGELPLLIVMGALVIQWARADARLARRDDRSAERDDDAELAAHNAMFAELASRDVPRREGSGGGGP